MNAMTRKNKLYKLRVAPGILGDGTFGVYLIPADDAYLLYDVSSIALVD